MPYAYVARHYGLHFEEGMRVRFTEPGQEAWGEVIRPKRTHLHYVRVKFTDGRIGLCHPRSLEPVAIAWMKEARSADELVDFLVSPKRFAP